MKQLTYKTMDGSHCGLTDWYPELESAIRQALVDGEPEWTTGWYASKKEIASAQITRRGDLLYIEASVSDDFDTPGYGSRSVACGADRPVEDTIQAIRDMIDIAWEAAETDQKDHRSWIMWSVHDDTGAWVETYLAAIDDDDAYGDGPPGDNYYQWGWQQEDTTIPPAVRRALEDGMAQGEGTVIVEGWTARMVD